MTIKEPNNSYEDSSFENLQLPAMLSKSVNSQTLNVSFPRESATENEIRSAERTTQNAFYDIVGIYVMIEALLKNGSLSVIGRSYVDGIISKQEMYNQLRVLNRSLRAGQTNFKFSGSFGEVDVNLELVRSSAVSKNRLLSGLNALHDKLINQQFHEVEIVVR